MLLVRQVQFVVIGIDLRFKGMLVFVVFSEFVSYVFLFFFLAFVVFAQTLLIIDLT